MWEANYSMIQKTQPNSAVHMMSLLTLKQSSLYLPIKFCPSLQWRKRCLVALRKTTHGEEENFASDEILKTVRSTRQNDVCCKKWSICSGWEEDRIKCLNEKRYQLSKISSNISSCDLWQYCFLKWANGGIMIWEVFFLQIFIVQICYWKSHLGCFSQL